MHTTHLAACEEQHGVVQQTQHQKLNGAVPFQEQSAATITAMNHSSNVITRAQSFPWAAEFQAAPRNLAVAAELPCFRGISRNAA